MSVVTGTSTTADPDRGTAPTPPGRGPAASPATTAGPPPGTEMTHRQVLEVLAGLLSGLFTALLSTTIVATALPTIIGDLGGTQTAYTWVVTAALLANAVSTPLWGKLADLVSKKLLVQVSLVVFVLGSVVAAASQDVTQLIAARVVQGIGMGGLTALVVAIIGSVIPPRQRGRYSGYMGAVMAVAMSGGPIVGGLVVGVASWRWTFLACVPLAVVALVLIQRTLVLVEEKRRPRVDWLGALLLTTGVSTLLIWVSFVGDSFAWVSWQTGAMVGGGLLLCVALVLVEQRHPEPIIPLEVLKERTTALAVVASIAVGIGLFGSSVFLGQYFQTARGYSALDAGLLTLPSVVGSLVGTIVSGRLITRYGRWKRFLVAGAVLMVVGLGATGTIDHLTPLWHVGVFIAITGLGTGCLMQNLVLAVQNTVPLRQIGAASSSVAFFRTLGGTVGVSVLGSVLASRVATLTTQGFADAGVVTGSDGGNGGGSLDVGALPGPAQEVVRAAYGDATGLIFVIAAVFALLTLLAVSLVREVPLRTTVDVQAPAEGAAAPLTAAEGAAVPATDAPATGAPAADERAAALAGARHLRGGTGSAG
ncbi:EmrB/QacA subfamily drug resistance transporter [Pseudokineococcus lusitanus]|uniref:EmrB/QacA subfamily drug resistance transporter n=2 Tax=Pseudokineococcus lusitanus TaxID=763993 RepID=A0A3N1HKG4_9ACTN|nr:MDR family MFS transporter [Pseudokineococcus lusitanus]ROP42832.1 EmrB/QacA subfamily drug resistance transporter [Pseudokineococcus lusitanus]